jgi:hypothetical protein
LNHDHLATFDNIAKTTNSIFNAFEKIFYFQPNKQ